VTALLDEPGSIAAWEEEVRRGFRPSGWEEAARAILHAFAPVPA